jgi:5-hydroxyisourate hydrolase-like protein (transthyretin family)
MVAAPLSFLETVLTGLAHASWQAAVLGLLVFLVSWARRGRLNRSLLLRRRPKYRRVCRPPSLVRRINMIATYRKPTAAGKSLGALLLFALAALGLTDAAAQAPNKTSTDQAPTAVKESEAKTLTITGVCQDEAGKPLAGVQVSLYRQDFLKSRLERLRAETAGDDGRVQFRDLPPQSPEADRPVWRYAIAAAKPGKGSIVWGLFADWLKDPLVFKLRPAATLQGRVTDPTGKPVAGAQVWAGCPFDLPVDGICSTRTDADGRYAITDMAVWGPDFLKPQRSADGKSSTVMVGGSLDILHPTYAHVRPLYRHMPDTVDVVLPLGGIIDGKVVDQVNGKPAADVVVCIQGTHTAEGGGFQGFQDSRTDSDGKYCFSSLLAGKYNLWAQAPDRTCTALDSFAVEAGKTQTAPDLSLIEGGWIEGRLVDAATGKPISGAVKGSPLEVALYGPSRPRSGAAAQSSKVDEQGRFRLHVALGTNFPYIMRQDYWERTQHRDFFQKGIEVKSGEVVSIVFRILPTKLVADPDPAPVRLMMPVPAERQAAALIRQLGGWYEVDSDNRVVEVNMVSHGTPDGQHFGNDRTDTDEALRAVSAFPRLKRLILQGGQATDDGLLRLTKLSHLEALFVADAVKATDAGVRHLAGLTKLKMIQVSNGQLSDDSLAVFGQMPGLKMLSLQGNSFSDEGLKHLADLKQLRNLSVGMSRKPITDAGVSHLSDLTALESLDLQGARLTDKGVAALKNLKEMRSLDLNGPAITDESVEYLLGMTKLQHLNVSNTGLTEKGVDRLLTLPELKSFYFPSAAISPEHREEVRKRWPRVQVLFTNP